MSGSTSLKRPWLLGHRGARAVRSIPENSIESFERALADGCDGFEFDVRLTADGQAVVFHDAKYKRCEIARASGNDLPELPRLEDVLARFYQRAFLDIELKVEGLEPVTVELLRRYQPTAGFVVSSFLPEVLRTLRSQEASIPIGLICETDKEFEVWRDVEAQYVIPHHKLLNAESASMLRRAGKKILAWTVNAAHTMKKCRDFGVSGIISDETKLLSETLTS